MTPPDIAAVAGKLTKRDREVLEDLVFTNVESSYPLTWATPLDLGGGSRSDHSYRLAKLARLGLVESKQRGASNDRIGVGPRACGMSRGSKCYRVSPAGQAVRAHMAAHDRPSDRRRNRT